MTSTLTFATRTFTVGTTRGTRSVESSLRDSEAIGILATLSAEFPRSLASQYTSGRNLSHKQWAWVHVLAVEAQQKAAQAQQEDRSQVEALVQDDYQMDRVIALFQKASEKLQYPKLRLADSEGVHYRLSLAGEKSKYQGSVHVCTASGTWLGRISSDGLWFPGREAKNYPGLLDLLCRLAADPVAVAREYGHTTGNCCFCRLSLTDPRSLKVGYGPVCASRYSLPYGD